MGRFKKIVLFSLWTFEAIRQTLGRQYRDRCSFFGCKVMESSITQMEQLQILRLDPSVQPYLGLCALLNGPSFLPGQHGTFHIFRCERNG